MRLTSSFLLTTALAVSLLPAAYAASTPTDSKTADQDFGKLSADGVAAFHDLRMARVSIFDGQIDRAKTDIGRAIAAMQKAKADDSAFTAAEADLKQPASAPKPAASDAKPSTTRVVWLPVDGAMALGEDFAATPDKKAAVAAANAKLEKGNKKDASETLRLANIDVVFLVVVAPLNATMAGLEQAKAEIDGGHLYEANQTLKGIEDGMRYDTVTLNDKQKEHAAK